MSESATSFQQLESMVAEYRKMVAGSHDADTALQLKIAIYQLALTMIKVAPIHWDKFYLGKIARTALEGTDD